MKKKDINLSDITSSPGKATGTRKPKRKTMRFLSRYKASAPTGFAKRIAFLGLPTLAALMIVAVLVIQIKLSIGQQAEIKFELPEKNQFELDQLSEQEMGRNLGPGEIAVLEMMENMESAIEIPPTEEETIAETEAATEQPAALIIETESQVEEITETTAAKKTKKTEAEKTVYANTVLNFRASAHVDGAKLGQLYYGEAVKQLAKEGSWAYIRNSKGVEGYALAKYLQAEKPAPRVQATKAPTEASSTEPAKTEKKATETAGTTQNPNIITTEKDPPSSIRYVKVNMANIRTEPNAESERVAFAQKGTQIEIIKVEGDWAKVKTETGLIGYMSTDLFQKDKVAKENNTINMGVDNWVQVNYGYLRAEASTDSEAIGTVRLNDKVHQISTDGIWSKVKLASGQEGYLRNDLLTSKKPEITEPTQPAPEAPSSEYRNTNVDVYVTVAYANLRESDSTSSSVVGAATQDEKLTQIATNGSWSKIKTKNGLVAYIKNDLITKDAPGNSSPPANNDSGQSSSFKDVNKDAWIRVSAANVREKADTSSAVLTSLPYATKIKQLTSNGTWSKISYGKDKEGYMLNTLFSNKEVEQIEDSEPESPETDSNAAKRKAVVEKAKSALGVRYVFAGSSMNGFDCSGLVKWVYSSIGVSLPHSANQQGNKHVKNVSFSKGDYSNVKLGDLVFFGSVGKYDHVGIYVGDGKMIHAPQPGSVVRIDVIANRPANRQPVKIGRIIN